jgi:hypothetical protein
MIPICGAMHGIELPLLFVSTLLRSVWQGFDAAQNDTENAYYGV